eukprot:2973730-Alexandrium_andersonii.AAC.1
MLYCRQFQLQVLAIWSRRWQILLFGYGISSTLKNHTSQFECPRPGRAARTVPPQGRVVQCEAFKLLPILGALQRTYSPLGLSLIHI